MSSLPPGFRWEPNDHVAGGLWLVRIRGLMIVGSVSPRVTEGWLASIDRYRWLHRSAVAPSREVAIRWVERWCWARAGFLATVEQERPPGSAESVRTWRKS